MPPLTAIIMSAGVNRRLGKTPVPKALLPLSADGSGPSFLERHVTVLQSIGVERVVVVLSAQGEAICPRLAGMETVVNPFDTSATGSTLSLLCALRMAAIPADHGLLIMDADIVYEEAMLQWIVDQCGGSQLFVAPDTAGDDEEVRVYGHGPDAPRLIGKGFPLEMVAGMTLLGESLGIIHVAPSDRDFLRAAAEWLAGWPPDLKAYGWARERSEHEELWQYCFSARRMGVSRPPADLLYSECDTPKDYQLIRDRLFPAILAREGGRTR